MKVRNRNTLNTIPWKSELLQIVLIWLLGGSFQVLIIEGVLFGDRDFVFIEIFFNGAFWALLWKGSQYQVVLLDYLGISWENQGVLRVILSLVSISIYVILVVLVVYTSYYVGYAGVTLQHLFSQISPSWFYTSLLITIGASAFMHGRGFWIEWRIASKERENYRIESSNFRFQALKNQVNPHFLFNSLNVLSSLVYEDQDGAVKFIRKLSEVYRYVLDRQDEELVSINEELAFIKSFVFLQKIRFGESLSIEIKGEASGSLPPMALQVLIENAIKHNIVSESKPLIISLKLEGDTAVVENNIQEKLSKDSTGIGLNNLKSRYEYLTDREVIISNDGVIFSVTIPLLNIKS